MELRNLFTLNTDKKRAPALATGKRTDCSSWLAPATAPHQMPRMLSEDVGVPELRVAHALAARCMPTCK